MGNGVAGYKEFVNSRHHEMILGSDASNKNIKNSTSSVTSEKKESQLSASNSKLYSRSSISVNNVLKKAVVATKSWAGDGSSHKNSSGMNKSKVTSTRSFSSGLCSLMAEGGSVLSNIEGSPRPFMFDPIVSPGQSNTPVSRGAYHACLVSRGGDYSSGAVSLDGAQQSHGATRGDMRSLTSLTDARLPHSLVTVNKMASASQRALCDQCFVANNIHHHNELHHHSHQRTNHGHLQQHSIKYQQHKQRPRCACEQSCSPLLVSGVYDSASCCSGAGDIYRGQHRMSWHDQQRYRHCGAPDLCRCSSDVRLPEHHGRRDVLCSAKGCTACYLGYGGGYGGTSYTSLQATSSSCIHKYDDYVDYTESPYASHSPYRNQSPYRGQSPYTSHYDTPPLSYHSPPVASSPSHSYYSPSDSYTTPTENLQAGNAGGVYATLHSLNNIPSLESSLSGNLHAVASLLTAGGAGLCSCADDATGYGGDVCQDPCKESCGGQVCCTSIGRSNTGRYKHYISGHQHDGHGGSARARQDSHPNWKSTESHQEEDDSVRATKVTSSRSEGLLCTEL